MLTPESTIKELGGTGSVSAELGLPLSTVSTWRTRGIPPRRWSDIVRLASEKGLSHITFEALAASQPAEPAEART